MQRGENNEEKRGNEGRGSGEHTERASSWVESVREMQRNCTGGVVRRLWEFSRNVESKHIAERIASVTALPRTLWEGGSFVQSIRVNCITNNVRQRQGSWTQPGDTKEEQEKGKTCPRSFPWPRLSAVLFQLAPLLMRVHGMFSVAGGLQQLL